MKTNENESSNCLPFTSSGLTELNLAQSTSDYESNESNADGWGEEWRLTMQMWPSSTLQERMASNSTCVETHQASGTTTDILGRAACCVQRLASALALGSFRERCQRSSDQTVISEPKELGLWGKTCGEVVLDPYASFNTILKGVGGGLLAQHSS